MDNLNLNNKRTLITGAAGFIGTNLAKKLSENNDVISLDLKESLFGKSLVEDIKKDTWIDKVGKVDFVFHLAAIVGVDYVSRHPFETMDAEIFGMSNIIKHAIKYKPKKIVFSSTSAVYGDIRTLNDTSEETKVNPISTYGTAKILAELYLKELKKIQDIDYSIVRFFNAYGPYQETKMVIPRFIKNALNDEDIVVFGDGKQTRDFTYIRDLVNCFIHIALDQKANGEIFNIGTGKETSLQDLARLIKKMTGSSSQIVNREPPKHREKFEIRHRVCNTSKMNSLLGLHCNTSLENGIKKTIEFIKQTK